MTSQGDKLNETQSKLARRFPASQVKTRSQGGKTLHYIDIAETISRFNEVLGLGWSFDVISTDVTLLEGEATRSGKQLYRVDVQARLTIYREFAPQAPLQAIWRDGVGSDTADDVDKALKTAQAEAFKKAGHQYGVGLYLWDQRERDLVDVVKAGKTNAAAKLLMEIEGLTAEDAKAHGSVEELLENFNLV